MRIELQKFKTPALTDGFRRPYPLAIEDDKSMISQAMTDTGKAESP